MAKSLEFNRHRLVDAFLQKGHHDAAWNMQVLVFLDRAAQYVTWRDAWHPFVPAGVLDAHAIASAGEDLIRSGCTDPSVLTCTGLALADLTHRDRALHDLTTGLAGLKAENAPPETVLLAATTLRNISVRRWEMGDDLESVLVDGAIGICRGLGPAPTDRSDRMETVYEAVGNSAEMEAKVAAALKAAPDADPWLREVVGGRAEIDLGWVARGSGWASEVTPEGWKQFAIHLAAARKLLTDAWRMDPRLPQAAECMISVVMGEDGNQSGETVQTWFDRALDAKCDDYRALDAMLWALRPRWGGSYEQMLQVGLDAAATKRYDTAVPGWYMRVIEDIASDRGVSLADCWSDPTVYAKAQEILNGYARAMPPGRGRDWIDSWHAALAWQAGAYDESRVLLDSLGNRLSPEWFGHFAMNPRVAVSQVYAFTGPFGPEVRSAADELKSGSPEEGKKRFQAVRATLAPGDRAALYLDEHIRLVDFDREFAAGRWADIQPDSELSIWEPSHGDWKVNGDGTLVGRSDEYGLLLRLMPNPGPRFELVMTLDYESRTPGLYAGVFPNYFGGSWMHGLFVSRDVPQIIWYANGQRGRERGEIGAKTEMHLRLWDGCMAATLNGRPVPLPGPDLKSPNWSVPRTFLAVGALQPGVQMTLHISGMKIRRLTKAPPGMTDAGSESH